MFIDRKFIIYLSKKSVGRRNFLNNHVCLKQILRLIMAFKFGCGIVK